MRINLSKFQINISKSSHVIKKADIDFLNEQSILSILKNGPEFYINKLKDITISSTASCLFENIVDKVQRDGICIVPNFLSADSAKLLCEIIEGQTSECLKKMGPSECHEDESYIVQRKTKLVKGYSNLANHSKPVLDVRTGADEGMIDIFNIDKLLRDKTANSIISGIKNNKMLSQVLSNLPQRLEIENINTYVNSGITSTRGFHVDSYAKQIKVFIYLTDVLTFDCGPYTFVKGTHLDTPYRRVNQHLSQALKAKTETPILPFDKIYPVLATKGSLIISDQSGFHRGFPQSESGNRRVLTLNCK